MKIVDAANCFLSLHYCWNS